MGKSVSLAVLLDLTKTTQTLLTHFQASLAPTSPSDASIPPPPNPLQALKACALLLKSHTTTLSLLLLTPPLTPSAIVTKIGDVNSGPLTGLVGAAVAQGGLGTLMQTEIRAHVRRLIASWAEVIALVTKMAEGRRDDQPKDGTKSGEAKDKGPTDTEKADVLAATGLVWETCDALVKLCDGGIAGLVVRKAEEWRSVLLDAVEELKEWGEDVDDGDDGVLQSDDEGDDGDAMFEAANRLKKSDEGLKKLLDKSVRKLKMVSVLYQALIKRRLKTFVGFATTNMAECGSQNTAMATLEDLMRLLKSIPEQVDDLASAFYDLDQGEAETTLDRCCRDAKDAASLVKQSWTGKDDEFTAWSIRWIDALTTSEP